MMSLAERYFPGAMPGRNVIIAGVVLVAILAALNAYAPAEPTAVQRLLASLLIVLCAVPMLRWVAGHAEQSLLPYLGILTGLYFGGGIFLRRNFFGQWLNGPRIADPLIEIALLVALGGWLLLLVGYYGMGYGRINAKLPRINVAGPSPLRITMWLAVGIGVVAAPFLYFDSAHVSAFYAGITLLPPAIAFPVNLISEMMIFSILILYYLLLRGELNTISKVILALLSVYYLVLGLSTGLILQGLTALFALFIAHAMVAPRPTWKVAVYGCLTAALVVFVLVPLRDDFRTLIWTHGVDPDEDHSWRTSAHEVQLSEVRGSASDPIIASDDYSVFLQDRVLTYAYQDAGLCNEAVENGRETAFFIHLVPDDTSQLPEGRVAHGFDNLDFAPRQVGQIDQGQCVHQVALPDYEITTMRTGLYLRNVVELAPVRQELQTYVATRLEADTNGEWLLETRDGVSWEIDQSVPNQSRLSVFLDDEIELNNALWIQPGYTLQISLDEDNWAHYTVAESKPTAQLNRIDGVNRIPNSQLVFRLGALLDSKGDRAQMRPGAAATLDYSILKGGLKTPAPASTLPNVSTETFAGPGRNPTAPAAQESQAQKTLLYLGSLGRLIDQQLAQLPLSFNRGLITSTYRLDFLVPLAYLISVTPEQLPYLLGDTYYPLLVKPVPRAVYADKPDELAEFRRIGQNYALLPPGNEINVFKVHQMGELYINFGIAGVLLGMLLLGAVFRALHRLFFHSGATAVTMAAGALIMTKLLLGMEGWVSTVWGFVLWYAVLLVLLWAAIRLAERFLPQLGIGAGPAAVSDPPDADAGNDAEPSSADTRS